MKTNEITGKIIKKSETLSTQVLDEIKKEKRENKLILSEFL